MRPVALVFFETVVGNPPTYGPVVEEVVAPNLPVAPRFWVYFEVEIDAGGGGIPFSVRFEFEPVDIGSGGSEPEVILDSEFVAPMSKNGMDTSQFRIHQEIAPTFRSYGPYVMRAYIHGEPVGQRRIIVLRV